MVFLWQKSVDVTARTALSPKVSCRIPCFSKFGDCSPVALPESTLGKTGYSCGPAERWLISEGSAMSLFVFYLLGKPGLEGCCKTHFRFCFSANFPSG